MGSPDAVRAVTRITTPFTRDVHLPGSKSYSNRALLVAALANGRSTLRGLLDSADTRTMIAALRSLGVEVVGDIATGEISLSGQGGTLPPGEHAVDVGHAGTAARFLPAWLATGPGRYTVDGSARMRERPIAPLVDALRTLGSQVDYLSERPAFPLRISSGDSSMSSHIGGHRRTLRVRGDLSSQYLSGLLMTAPLYPGGLAIGVEGSLVSRPYVRMTTTLMAEFGVQVQEVGSDEFIVPHARYQARDYAVEPDASAASYFFAAAAVTGSQVSVRGLGTRSLQGDLGLVDVLERMGCRVQRSADETTLTGPPVGELRGVDANMGDLSDVAQSLAVVALFANGTTRVRGIGFIRGKESDRVGAVVQELRRLGAHAVEHDDGYDITPAPLNGATIETYDDHRMAMSFAVAGLRVDGVVIRDPDCVAKTFPNFWAELDALA